MKQGILVLLMSLVLVSCGEQIVVEEELNEGGGLLRECPEEHIHNKMGGPDIDDVSRQYYIADGARREMKEYDVEWVEKKCDLEVQEVW